MEHTKVRKNEKQGEDGKAGKSSRWWWFIVQCDSEADAVEWRLPKNPIHTYAIYRAHAAPTTGKPHVHCLVNYKTSQKFVPLQKKGYSNLKFCSTRTYQQHNRNYVIEDNHKDGTSKNPLAPYVEEGEWKEGKKQGVRNDLNDAKAVIFSKKRWREVLHDSEITDTVAKYGKWAKEMYDNRPQEIPPVVLEKGLQPYQKVALALFEEKPLDRRLIWIWSEESKTGKSKFYSYCCQKYKILDGKSLDDREILAGYDQHEIIWFDLTRYTGERSEKYENHKFGLLETYTNIQTRLSWKYHCVEKYINSHIVVTSNDPPPFVKIPDRCVEIKATLLVDYNEEEGSVDLVDLDLEKTIEISEEDTEELSEQEICKAARAIGLLNKTFSP